MVRRWLLLFLNVYSGTTCPHGIAMAMAMILKLLIMRIVGRRSMIVLTPGCDTVLDGGRSRVIDTEKSFCKCRDVPGYNMLRWQWGKRQLDTSVGVCVTQGKGANASLQEAVFLVIN